MEDNVCRSIKISKEALLEFIYENFINQEEKLFDLDKMWDALHFVLTGVSSLEPVKNDPLSEAVAGRAPIEDVEEYIAYTEKSRIKDIVFALEHFDIEEAMERM